MKQNQKKHDDNHADDSQSAESINKTDDCDECANDKHQDDVNSENADKTTDFDRKTDDVPDKNDSQNNHEHSLGENQLSSNTNEIETSNTTNSFGGCNFIRKQWHRRLRTPVWARCSIIQIYSVLYFFFIVVSLFSSICLQHLFFITKFQYF